MFIPAAADVEPHSPGMSGCDLHILRSYQNCPTGQSSCRSYIIKIQTTSGGYFRQARSASQIFTRLNCYDTTSLFQPLRNRQKKTAAQQGSTVGAPGFGHLPNPSDREDMESTASAGTKLHQGGRQASAYLVYGTLRTLLCSYLECCRLIAIN
jgi:hypothetical protein